MAIDWETQSESSKPYVNRWLCGVAAVVLLFTALAPIFFGMDFFSSGPSAIFTGCMGIIASATSLLFAVRPQHSSRVVALIFVSIVVGIRVIRTFDIAQIIDGSNVWMLVGIEFVPPASLLWFCATIPDRVAQQEI